MYSNTATSKNVLLPHPGSQEKNELWQKLTRQRKKILLKIHFNNNIVDPIPASVSRSPTGSDVFSCKGKFVDVCNGPDVDLDIPW